MIFAVIDIPKNITNTTKDSSWPYINEIAAMIIENTQRKNMTFMVYNVA